ncbi:MAG: Asp-tRNA(Asn)/Glu-tRNA(Gln) amidotransferase subunit GatA [Anaerolineae bacterium]|jgi:aspartyl-tRNA(Asn)/glutamyl-tRNA(Gln) amidotransferase subunit A|nr:Asp-tRNA(Asn)/Glu-tRNA(Gln) amidotransferase subunit GatA [Anaerolineae bacterium]
MNELLNLSAVEMLAGLGNGEFTSEELTRACLERISQLEPDIHAFLYLDEKGALECAKATDLRRRQWQHWDEPLPPLLGLPIAVKDVLMVEGMPCTCGSKILENFIAPYTATAVQKLLDAGVIILGKTNTDEFAMGSSTENSAYGATRNPWNPAHVPGGSSGGSAAAVAAHMVPVALGTDTGGSVRQPASFCGVCGIKPTYGRVSRYGLVAYGSSLDSVGVLARSTEDVAVIFQQMAGEDAQDATSNDRPVPDYSTSRDSLKGIRIGVPKEYFLDGMQQEVIDAVSAAIAHMESLGAEIKAISLPHTEYAVPVYYLLAPAEASANLSRFDGVRYGPRMSDDTLMDVYYQTRGDRFGPEVKRRIMLGTYALSAGYYDAYYAQAQKVRTLMQQDYTTAFAEVDVIAAPIAPSTALKFGEHTDDPLAMYLEDVFTLPANLAGIPGLAFPVGFDDAGLPIDLQLMAAPFNEKTLFEIAECYQANSDWHTKQAME